MRKYILIAIACAMLLAALWPISSEQRTIGNGALVAGFGGGDGTAATLYLHQVSGVSLLTLELTDGRFNSVMLPGGNRPDSMTVQSCGRYIYAWATYGERIEYYRFDTGGLFQACIERVYAPALVK